MGKVGNINAHTIIFLNRKKLVRDFDAQVVSNLDLAGKADVGFLFGAAEEWRFRRQQVTGARGDLEFAQATGASSAARTWDKDFFGCEYIQNRCAALNGQFFFAVDIDLTLAVISDKTLSDNEDSSQARSD